MYTNHYDVFALMSGLHVNNLYSIFLVVLNDSKSQSMKV